MPISSVDCKWKISCGHQEESDNIWYKVEVFYICVLDCSWKHIHWVNDLDCTDIERNLSELELEESSQNLSNSKYGCSCWVWFSDIFLNVRSCRLLVLLWCIQREVAMENGSLLDSTLCFCSWLLRVQTQQTSFVLRRKYHMPVLFNLLHFKFFVVVLRRMGWWKQRAEKTLNWQEKNILSYEH